MSFIFTNTLTPIIRTTILECERYNYRRCSVQNTSVLVYYTDYVQVLEPAHHHHKGVVVVGVHRMAAVGRRSLRPLPGLRTDQQVELVQERGLELLSPLRNLGMVWLICYVQNLCGGLPTVNKWNRRMNEISIFFSFGASRR